MVFGEVAESYHRDRPNYLDFVRLDRQIDSPIPLTRDGATQIINRTAQAAGRSDIHACHSLRTGLITDALDVGATCEQVQRHGRWSDIRSSDPNYRKTEVSGRNNPSQPRASGIAER